MMIKYRVSEVAKDFGVPSKDVIELLAKYVDTPKKSATALEENELDLVFEHFTQKNSVENFDAYFATAAEKKEPEKAPAMAAPAATAPTAPAHPSAPAVGPRPAAPAQKPPKAPAAPRPQIERRTVDTRTPQVNVGRYDEKFDVLAQTSKQVRGDGGGIKKQKINQKSQQYRRPHPRRETEAERLRRIQMERKMKPITITVGETITVAELASRLKATVAEVIKKLMGFGVMATANEEIDFDTAYLVAGEFHAKVEREVVVTIEERIIDDSEDVDENLRPRS